MIVDAEAFSRFVAALPREMEPELIRGTTVSTAFFAAMGAGWTEDALVDDAKAAARKGGQIGVIVLRLRSLASNPPVARDHVKGRPERQQFSPSVYVYVPPEWVSERRALLGTIAVEKPTPDEAEERMKALILAQNAREVVASDPFA